MNDHDELLARVEAELAAESGPSGMHYGDSTKRELYEALRAALAAQPQPNRCTGLTARWCPIHGDCRCEPIEGVRAEGPGDDAHCPLHAPTSGHAASAGPVAPTGDDDD